MLSAQLNAPIFFDVCADQAAERYGIPFTIFINFSQSFSGVQMPAEMFESLQAFAAHVQRMPPHSMQALMVKVLIGGEKIYNILPQYFPRS